MHRIILVLFLDKAIGKCVTVNESVKDTIKNIEDSVSIYSTHETNEDKKDKVRECEEVLGSLSFFEREN